MKMIAFLYLVLMVGTGGSEIARITGENLVGHITSFIGGVFIYWYVLREEV